MWDGIAKSGWFDEAYLILWVMVGDYCVLGLRWVAMNGFGVCMDGCLALWVWFAVVSMMQFLSDSWYLWFGCEIMVQKGVWKDIHSWLHTLLRGCPIFHIWMLRCGRIPSTPLAWLFPSRFVLTRKVLRSAIHTFLVIFGCVWWTLYEQLVFGSFGDIPDGIYVSLVVVQRFRESMYRFGQVLNSFGGFGERIRFQMFWLHVMACSWTMCLVMFVTWVRCFWAISHVNFTLFCMFHLKQGGEAVNRSRHKQKHLKTAFVSCGVWSKRKEKGVLSPLCNWSWNLCFVDFLDLTLGI